MLPVRESEPALDNGAEQRPCSVDRAAKAAQQLGAGEVESAEALQGPEGVDRCHVQADFVSSLILHQRTKGRDYIELAAFDEEPLRGHAPEQILVF